MTSPVVPKTLGAWAGMVAEVACSPLVWMVGRTGWVPRVDLAAGAGASLEAFPEVWRGVPAMEHLPPEVASCPGAVCCLVAYPYCLVVEAACFGEQAVSCPEWAAY